MKLKKTKRIVSLIIAFAMIVSFVPAVFAAEVTDFTDFPTGWSREAMISAVENGLLNGRTSTTINPEDTLTRAEMATIINRAFGATVEADISQYTDVSPTAWYYKEIAKAVNMRTFVGDSGNTMNPEANITREEVFTVIARAFVLSTDDHSSLDLFNDKNEISDWAMSATAALVANKYVNGYENNILAPKNNITREEFAQIMYNIVKIYYDGEGSLVGTINGNVLIRNGNITIDNVVINGDLIFGDGVGVDFIKLNNVIVNGRIVIRGGKEVTFKSTSVKGAVVVNNYNNTVNFNNYKSDSVFKNIIENTDATFKPGSGLGGGGGSSSGGNTPVVQEYYTVKFHTGANPTAFDKISVKKTTAAEDRNLKHYGKTLASIYAQQPKVETTYNRNSLAYNNYNTEYEHKVKAEYLYEKYPGVWAVFDEETQINKDIDVYYATKHAMVSARIEQLGIPLTLEVSYDSKSRAFDSLKDGLISAGQSLSQNAIKEKIDQKMVTLFETANAKTGMIDADGNILDFDYGLRVDDIFTAEQIQAEVTSIINGLLEGGEDDWNNVLKMIDIPTVVDTVGGKVLVEKLGVGAVRTTIVGADFRDDGIVFIQEKIKGDTEGALISSVLNSTAKDTLIDTIAGNNQFVVSLLESDFRSQVITIIKGDEIVYDLVDALENEELTSNIIGIIKGSSFINELTVIDKTDEKYASSLALRKVLIGNVAEVGKVYNVPSPNPKGYEEMSQSAKDVRDAVISIISTDSRFEDLSTYIDETPYAYEAIVEKYVTGENSTFNHLTVEDSRVADIDGVVVKVIEKYFSNDEEEQLNEALQAAIDNAIIDFAESYLYGETLIEGDDESDEKLNEVIENCIIDLIKAYFNGEIVFEDVEISNLVNSIKGMFIGKIKETDVDDLIEPIVTFVTDSENGDFVDTFVEDNYDTIIGSVDDDFIMEYINGMEDDEVDELVKTYATAQTIIEYVGKLDDDEKENFAEEVIDILNQYPPYVNFLNSFKNKTGKIIVDKDNVGFVEYVGDVINGFDYEKIRTIMEEKGWGSIFEVLGEDVVEEIFVGATESFWSSITNSTSEIRAAMELDPETTETREVSTILNVSINVPSVLHGLYNNVEAQFKQNLKLEEIYDYNLNVSLQKLASVDWFDLAIGYDPERIDEAAGVTGYYIRDFMDYYCRMLDVVILYDAALCFYDRENYTDEELVVVKKSLTKEFMVFLENLENLSAKIENGEPISGEFTLEDLIDKVESFKGIADMIGSSNAIGSGITTAVDSLTEILEGLGEGNLPNGYTLEELETLSARLQSTINALNENDYNKANRDFSLVINTAMSKLSAVIAELDEYGTISGKPIDNIMSKISVINGIYVKFKSQFEDIVSKIADANLGDAQISVDTEQIENMIFGREEENVLNVDTIINAVKDKLGITGTSGYDAVNGKYIVDKYSKSMQGNNISFERNFY